MTKSLSYIIRKLVKEDTIVTEMYYSITLPVSDQEIITLLHYLSLTKKLLHYYITCL